MHRYNFLLLYCNKCQICIDYLLTATEQIIANSLDSLFNLLISFFIFIFLSDSTFITDSPIVISEDNNPELMMYENKLFRAIKY